MPNWSGGHAALEGGREALGRAVAGGSSGRARHEAPDQLVDARHHQAEVAGQDAVEQRRAQPAAGLHAPEEVGGLGQHALGGLDEGHAETRRSRSSQGGPSWRGPPAGAALAQPPGAPAAMGAAGGTGGGGAAGATGWGGAACRSPPQVVQKRSGSGGSVLLQYGQIMGGLARGVYQGPPAAARRPRRMP